MARRIQQNPRDRVESQQMWRTTARPVDWPARVEAIKKRDKSCRWIDNGNVCGSVENVEVDHINDPADHSLDNLRLLCRSHHRRRTGQQGAQAAAAWRARNPRKRPDEPHPGLTT
ncbi:HNH endonuclease signature motif containing protein [Nonomuraea terrae]|uniref:HNH endonuclease signature motif containing protein n=1 Tax=Nonomuraea terrae TaxID=2530383 RepID=UPI00379D375C